MTYVDYVFCHTCIFKRCFLYHLHCTLMVSVLFYFIKLLVVTPLDFLNVKLRLPVLDSAPLVAAPPPTSQAWTVSLLPVLSGH